MLPVAEDVRHWVASPRAAVGFLVHAAELDSAPLGARRALTMPGLSATIAEQIEALRRVGGDKAVKLVRREPDTVIATMVAGWPRAFDASGRSRSVFAPTPRSTTLSASTSRKSSAVAFRFCNEKKAKASVAAARLATG